MTRNFLVAAIGGLIFTPLSIFTNGDAWQVGVPSTGNAAPSDKARSTEVAIEEEVQLIPIKLDDRGFPHAVAGR